MPPSEAPVADLDRLVAIEAISALKARYFRLMDQKRWDEWGGVFARDAVMDMTGEGPAMRALGFDLPEDLQLVWRSAQAIVDAVAGAMATVRSAHHGHMAEIEVLSADEARGVWAMEDVLVHSIGPPATGFRGYGHYYDSYVRRDGRWLIQSTRLERLMLVALDAARAA